MHLHEQGQKDYIKELKKSRDKEIREVENTTGHPDNKRSLIQKILNKFNELIKDSDESLFVNNKVKSNS